MSSRGLSLIETVLSLLLLCAAIFTVVTLFHVAMRRAKNVHHKARAARLAEIAMDEIRAASRDTAAYREGLPDYAGTERSYPEFPGFLVRTEVGPAREMLSPCSGLESRFANSKVLPGVVRTVATTVSWGPSGSSSLRVVGLVRQPRRQPGELVVRRLGSGGSVPPDGIFELEAELRDDVGEPIPGVSFLWSVRPLTGNATALPPLERNGHTARFQHRYYFNPVTSTWASVPGTLRVEARARYFGQEIDALSAPVELLP